MVVYLTVEVSADRRQGVAAWRKQGTPSFFHYNFFALFSHSLVSPVNLATDYTDISRQNLLSQYVMSYQVTNKYA